MGKKSFLPYTAVIRIMDIMNVKCFEHSKNATELYNVIPI